MKGPVGVAGGSVANREAQPPTKSKRLRFDGFVAVGKMGMLLNSPVRQGWQTHRGEDFNSIRGGGSPRSTISTTFDSEQADPSQSIACRLLPYPATSNFLS